jgi:hypothetical protein
VKEITDDVGRSADADLERLGQPFAALRASPFPGVAGWASPPVGIAKMMNRYPSGDDDRADFLCWLFVAVFIAFVVSTCVYG